MADFGTFLDINHFLGRVKSLNLFLRHVITSVDVVKGLEEAVSNKSLLKNRYRDVQNSKIYSRWGLFGPSGASRGKSKQTMVGIKVAYGILKCIRTMCCRSWGLCRPNEAHISKI